jgi:hypothetical protein
VTAASPALDNSRLNLTADYPVDFSGEHHPEVTAMRSVDEFHMVFGERSLGLRLCHPHDWTHTIGGPHLP